MKVRAKSTVNDRLIDESIHPHLSPGREYFVVGIDDGYYRLVNNNFEPVLYPKALFEVIESEIPEGWVKEEYADGEFHVGPPDLSRPGFYEDYFDGEPATVKAFKEYCEKLGLSGWR